MIQYILILLATAAIARVLLLIYKIISGKCQLITREPTLRTIVCIGSGGHTTEMLRIIGTLNAAKYRPLLYVLAENDVNSQVKIHKFENQNNDYEIRRIPRSRNVKQSYFTSIVSTLYATLHSFPLVYKFKPNIVMCNGPGTCIPLCIVVFLLRCLFILDCRIVFVESVCRVRTLSLSGKIMQFIADVFIIQWQHLGDVCFRATYFGRLT